MTSCIAFSADLRSLVIVVDEGYGLSYSVNNRTLRFIITSMNRGPNNNVQAFRHYIEEACNDVREVVEK